MLPLMAAESPPVVRWLIRTIQIYKRIAVLVFVVAEKGTGLR